MVDMLYLAGNVAASARGVENALNQASAHSRALYSASQNIISSVKSRSQQNEVRADYLEEADIAAVLNNIISAIKSLGSLMGTLEAIEKAEGPIEKGTHKRFMGRIEGELSQMQSAINYLKGIEARR